MMILDTLDLLMAMLNFFYLCFLYSHQAQMSGERLQVGPLLYIIDDSVPEDPFSYFSFELPVDTF